MASKEVWKTATSLRIPTEDGSEPTVVQQKYVQEEEGSPLLPTEEHRFLPWYELLD